MNERHEELAVLADDLAALSEDKELDAVARYFQHRAKAVRLRKAGLTDDARLAEDEADRRLEKLEL